MQFIDEALEIVIVFDRHGKVMYMNKKALSFFGYLEVPDIMVSDLFPDAFFCSEDKVEWADNVGFASTKQTAYKKNRTCADTMLRAAYIKSEYMTIVMALDMSEEKLLERRMTMANSRLIDANGVKDRFVANVSHELRTPINGIEGNIDVLLKNECDPDKRATLNIVKQQCENMRRTVDNIIDYTKVTENRDAEFNFYELLERIKQDHSRKIIDKGIDFFVDVSSDIPSILVGDEEKLEQILGILLSNATKFTSAGKVSLEVLKAQSRESSIELYFIVADTGIGISEQNKAHLFDSFSQVEQGSDRHFGGMGMGLWIAQKLVELMGGTIRVESEENEGSVFSFSVWVKEPGPVQVTMIENLHSFNPESMAGNDGKKMYGTVENRIELERKLSKLILCVEMRNWVKAESMMEWVRELTVAAPLEIKRIVLKLKIAVQKADYDSSVEEYELLMNTLQMT